MIVVNRIVDHAITVTKTLVNVLGSAVSATSNCSSWSILAHSTRSILVGRPGFEPGTSVLSGLRSNQLSYWPTKEGILTGTSELAGVAASLCLTAILVDALSDALNPKLQAYF